MGVQPGELIVDFSTTTSAMAAAVALVSRPFTSQVVQIRKAECASFSSQPAMVGSEPGVWEASNPWNEEARQARRDAAALFNHGAFSSVAQTFRHIAGLVSGSVTPLYHALGDLSEGYACWEACTIERRGTNSNARSRR